MKPFLTALLIAAVCLGAHAQNTSEQEQIQQRLDSLLDESAYQTMYELSDSAAQFNLLNDTARYYRCVALTYDPEIGLDSALNCLNEVHEVYGYNTSGYYNTRSWLFLLNEEYDSSFATVEQGLSLYPDTAYLYATKADVLFSLGDVEQAAILRQQVLDSGDAYPHHYGMQGDYYYDQSDPRAIDLYLYCADSLAQEPKEELGYRYTAGLSAQISGEFQRAIDILEQVIEEQRPPDHHTYSVLSLSYCGLHQFEEALALAKRAESLHKTKKLQSSNDEGLWFDEFYLKDKDHIQVICRWFPRDRDDLFYRHVFYRFNAEGMLVSTIQTEHSTALDMNDNPNYYVLGQDFYDVEAGNKTSHSTYWQHQFPESQIDYEELRNLVIRIFEEGEESSSSSTYPAPDGERSQESSQRRRTKRSR